MLSKSLISLGKTLGFSFLNLIYPPMCLHCKGEVNNHNDAFCEECFILLQLIEPTERCPRCFSSNYSLERHICSSCARKNLALVSIAAAFDYLGPAATLVKRLKYYDQSYLAKGLGAYLAVQLLRLGWPFPDYIIPVPITKTHWLERGYNQSELIAKSVSDLIDRPLKQALVRKSGDYSQAGLLKEQRVLLEGSSIQLIQGLDFRDKTLLLIDDVLTTGTTLQRCAHVLMGAFPASIYALTVCCTIE